MRRTSKLTLCALMVVCLSTSLFARQTAASSAPEAATSIPLDQIGAVAQKQYSGEGLTVAATEEGARLRCVFQRLEARATPQGLWIISTADTSQPFRVMAEAVGRESVLERGYATCGVRWQSAAATPLLQNDVINGAGNASESGVALRFPPHSIERGADAVRPLSDSMTALSSTGAVQLTNNLARFVRPGLTEEYSVSTDGVRQDFLIDQHPAGEGQLRVELSLEGATAESLPEGARLVLDDGGRKIAYTRLHATDAQGKTLPARIEVLSAKRLAVLLDDTAAQYPLRIDPTFSDENWVSCGGLARGDNWVFAVAVDNYGNLYIGGKFTMIGGALANRIAKWDGSSWSPLGSGMDAPVNALAVSGTNLYAGGSFLMAGGVGARFIAKWDGSRWWDLALGTLGPVSALAVSGDDVYAGGQFVTAGGVSANRIAKWNGSRWSALGSGMNGEVLALAFWNGGLYAGGKFTAAGGISANYIAKWDGTAWAALGAGLNNEVAALAASYGYLYVGGRFLTAGGVSANYIARWNGTAWSALGAGVNGNVTALGGSDSALYAGGYFTYAGGTLPANKIAKWNGSAWSALGSGMSPYTSVSALATSGNALYAGGDFTTAGGVPVNRVAKWNANEWTGLGSPMDFGMNAAVHALAISEEQLYAGGEFTTAGGVLANRIAKWDGIDWSALGSGMDGTVYALAGSSSNLYAGGNFTTAGGIPANRIAKWNGTAWSSLGSGMNNIVCALLLSGSNLYAGGQFTTAGGVSANHIARWNGTAWSALGSGVGGGTYPYVYALTESGSDLYVGGEFITAGGLSANRIAKWNGSQWSALGSGMTGGVYTKVYALALLSGDLYAGGSFTSAGGIPVNHIAKWNGSMWSGLGSGVTGVGAYVHALAVSGSDLYAGGGFTSAGGVSVSHIAKWNGSEWSALGSGMSNTLALAVSGSNLYAGGRFTVAGSKTCTFLAKAVGINAAPTAHAQYLLVDEVTATPISLSGSDPDAHTLSYVVVSAPTNGVLSGTPPALTYIPNAHFCGSDSFTFKASDGTLESAPATVSITVLSTQDTDGDGLCDAAEYRLSALGFDWQLSQPALVSAFYSNAESAGLYTETQLRALAPASPLLERDPASGSFTITLSLEQSTNLVDFAPLPLSAPQTTINPEGKLEFRFQSPDNAAFFRLHAW